MMENLQALLLTEKVLYIYLVIILFLVIVFALVINAKNKKPKILIARISELNEEKAKLIEKLKTYEEKEYKQKILYEKKLSGEKANTMKCEDSLRQAKQECESLKTKNTELELQISLLTRNNLNLKAQLENKDKKKNNIEEVKPVKHTLKENKTEIGNWDELADSLV